MQPLLITTSLKDRLVHTLSNTPPSSAKYGLIVVWYIWNMGCNGPLPKSAFDLGAVAIFPPIDIRAACPRHCYCDVTSNSSNFVSVSYYDESTLKPAQATQNTKIIAFGQFSSNSKHSGWHTQSWCLSISGHHHHQLAPLQPFLCFFFLLRHYSHLHSMALLFNQRCRHWRALPTTAC